jgi:hypothetical protein
MQPSVWGVRDPQDLFNQMDRVFEQEMLRIQQRLPTLREICLRGATSSAELLLLVEAHDCLEAATHLEPEMARLLRRIRQELAQLKRTNPALIQSLKVYSPAIDERFEGV